MASCLLHRILDFFEPRLDALPHPKSSLDSDRHGACCNQTDANPSRC
jgi:hypothetical protein